MKLVSLVFGVLPSLLWFVWIALGCRLPFLEWPWWDAGQGTNFAAFVCFCILHSALAQLEVDRHWYMTINGLYLFGMMATWSDKGGMIWSIGPWWLPLVLLGIYWIALLALLPSCGIFVLLGMKEPSEEGLFVGGAYRYVRHPMHLLMLAFLFITPIMTASRFIISLLTVAYLFVAVPLEEERLHRRFGVEWLKYKQLTWWFWLR